MEKKKTCRAHSLQKKNWKRGEPKLKNKSITKKCEKCLKQKISMAKEKNDKTKK